VRSSRTDARRSDQGEPAADGVSRPPESAASDAATQKKTRPGLRRAQPRSSRTAPATETSRVRRLSLPWSARTSPATTTGLAWRLSLPWSFGAAALAGLSLAGAFPPVGVWPLALAGPALLTLALAGKRPLPALALGTTAGALFFVPLLSWLVNVAWYAWAALAIIETLIFAAATLALPPLLRLRCWPLAAAGWWVAQEAVRDRFPWGGFPWGRLAMSQAAAPTAGWSAIGGPPLLTFLLALAGGGLAYLIITRTKLAAGVAAVAVAAVLCGNFAWRWSPSPGPSAQVATIQGNVPHSRNLPDQLRASTVTANHAAATFDLARAVKAGRRAAPDLVIWPENSTDIDPRYSPSTYQAISRAVTAINRPVLVGAVLDHPLRNAGQLWLPGRGPVKVYLKRRLVPFGEVIPYRKFLSHFTSLPSLQPRNFHPGHRAVVFTIGKIKLGDVICYEVGFDDLVRSEVSAGANLLTVQTNDADFELDGQLGETLQQLQMARMDAITTGRAVAVASTIGISAIIAPDGAILTQSGTWQRAELEARVPLVASLTPADRVGDWPELVITALTALGLLWAVAGVRLRRRVTGRAASQ
jgi:apolipoprotein N-acyltransferase